MAKDQYIPMVPTELVHLQKVFRKKYPYEAMAISDRKHKDYWKAAYLWLGFKEGWRLRKEFDRSMIDQFYPGKTK